MATHVEQGAPWSVQIELVEGCTRFCTFCGINGIRNGPGEFKMMRKSTARAIADGIVDLCPQARIEFAMHGEPMAHNEYARMVSIFRDKLPKAQMQITTNGVKLQKASASERIKELFDSGIDFIVVDTYMPEREKLRLNLFSAGWTLGIAVVDLHKDLAPQGISPWHNHHRKLCDTVVLVDDLSLTDGKLKSRKIYNHAGNSGMKPALLAPLNKTCTIPFRELSVCWNGDVCVCCMDFGHELVVGNARDDALRDIWFGKKFNAVRSFLRHKRRLFSPCCRCDAGSGTRPGLLPIYPVPDTRAAMVVRKLVEAGTGINKLKPWVLFNENGIG
jgi:MoaA/NifB/PqqE/SkfB family radical SAM enzyme